MATKSASLTILAAVRNNFSSDRQRFANWDIQLPFGGRPLKQIMQIGIGQNSPYPTCVPQSTYHQPISSSLKCSSPTRASIPWLERWPLLQKSREIMPGRWRFSQRLISSNDPKRERFWQSPVLETKYGLSVSKAQLLKRRWTTKRQMGKWCHGLQTD